MASAPPKTSNGSLPAGFVSPFNRVPMQGTHDDLLACAAVITNKTMEEVKKMAVTLGMRANGPFFMDEVLFRKILFNLLNLAVSDYKDFTTVNLVERSHKIRARILQWVGIPCGIGIGATKTLWDEYFG